MATIEDVYKFLKEDAPTYYLATVEGDQPRVRAFGTVDLFEGKIYIQTGKSKDVFKQIQDNNKVEICACSGPDWWRITATLVADERPEAIKHMLDNYPELRAMYDENDGNAVVLYLDHAQARFASLGGKEADSVEW